MKIPILWLAGIGSLMYLPYYEARKGKKNALGSQKQ